MNISRIGSLVLAVFILHSAEIRLQADSPEEDMAAAAHAFLAALASEQRAKASFPLGNEERFNWHFIPKDRNGLPVKEMTSAQKHLAFGLLNSAMSNRGFMKATAIMSLEQILQDMEGPNRRFPRDPELYYFSIFGTPDAKNTWAWRVEGHHLSLNFTVVRSAMTSVTPSFFGTNPAQVKSGPRKGLQVLAREENLARELVRSLTDSQKEEAVFSETAPRDIITGADRRARLLEPLGLPLSKMARDQSTILWNLIKERVRQYRGELASRDLEKIEQSGRDKIYFAWAGSTEPGNGHYYRVQGPTFLMEYDNTQNNANHVHAVWRDLESDFGEDLLKKHYRENAH